MILVRTQIEIEIDGKVVQSTGDTFQCPDRVEAERMWQNVTEAAYREANFWRRKTLLEEHIGSLGDQL